MKCKCNGHWHSGGAMCCIYLGTDIEDPKEDPQNSQEGGVAERKVVKSHLMDTNTKYKHD